MIDWRLAHRTGTRFSGRGPDVSAAQADEIVAELRDAASRAQAPVREFTGLTPATDATPVLIVDRPGWIEANLATFSELLEPAVTALDRGSNPVVRRVGGAVSGAEIGAVMGLISGRVLGQFDPFWTGSSGEPGRLLVVAPNVVEVERKLGVVPSDFRLWVCLHEETHRVQFTAVPWMREHLQGIVAEFLEHTDPDTLGQMFERAAGAVRGDGPVELSSLFQSAEQRALIDKATGVMSLLEGHADVVMDGVGPDVVRTVRSIRRKFTQRREKAGPIDRLVRKVLGMEGKLRQYKDGAKFVRTVTDRVGMEGFNAVWSSPDALPTKEEILSPEQWLTRLNP